MGIMTDLNTMWTSTLQACACGPDLPICANNALSLSFSQGGRGYVYYDRAALEMFLRFGSLLAPAWFIGHEVGHNIQQAFNASPPVMQNRELGADCYSGYFIGWLRCNGRVNPTDIMATLAAACSFGDGTGYPWFDVNTHGTCVQRQQAILLGMNAFDRNIPPINACTF